VSDRKADIRNVGQAMRDLFVGTDSQQAKRAAAIAEDLSSTVKRARARDGAINALGDAEGEDEGDGAELAPSARIAIHRCGVCGQCWEGVIPRSHATPNGARCLGKPAPLKVNRGR
jgi:hypothetical protein